MFELDWGQDDSAETDATAENEPCPNCGGRERHVGYGLAGGGIGIYESCMGCGQMLNKEQDPEAGG